MAKSQNPMDAFRREQKKKASAAVEAYAERGELKKHQVQRQKDKHAKLAELDVDEIRERLKKLERQVQQNPADGPTRKRKQELEDTLNAVLKKHKAMEEEQKEEQAATKTTMTLSDLNAANREKYQNPENSIYYHPVLNPFGAPPPGRPQMYRVPPPAPRPSQQQQPHHPRSSQHHQRADAARSDRAAAPRRPVPTRSGPMKPQRPGKRPPLPPGPPPPGTIQVPSRPPLPRSREELERAPRPPPPAVTTRPTHAAPPPPPPPPAYAPNAQQAPPPPPPPLSVDDVDMADATSVVGVYPPLDDNNDSGGESAHQRDSHGHAMDDGDSDDDDDEGRMEKQQRLRSLVPTTLRVQRVAKPSLHQAAGAASASMLPRSVPRPPPPPPSVPGPALAPLPSSAAAAEPLSSSSVSSEFDAFMEEIKGLCEV